MGTRYPFIAAAQRIRWEPGLAEGTSGTLPKHVQRCPQEPVTGTWSLFRPQHLSVRVWEALHLPEADVPTCCLNASGLEAPAESHLYRENKHKMPEFMNRFIPALHTTKGKGTRLPSASNSS